MLIKRFEHAKLELFELFESVYKLTFVSNYKLFEFLKVRIVRRVFENPSLFSAQLIHPRIWIYR